LEPEDEAPVVVVEPEVDEAAVGEVEAGAGVVVVTMGEAETVAPAPTTARTSPKHFSTHVGTIPRLGTVLVEIHVPLHTW
jgi:hypothetical protein